MKALHTMRLVRIFGNGMGLAFALTAMLMPVDYPSGEVLRAPLRSCIDRVNMQNSASVCNVIEIWGDVMKPEPWVSLEEIAEHLGVSTDTVHRWIRNRKMPAHKVGHLWKFKVSQVDSWVQAGKTDTEKQGT